MKTYYCKSHLLISLIFLCFCLAPAIAAANPGQLRILQENGVPRVALQVQGKTVLVSPQEGLWSIATQWQDSWPARWRHAAPDTVEKVGEWTVLRGRLTTDQGEWHLSDAYRSLGSVIQCRRRFEWKSRLPLRSCTLSVRFQASGCGPGVLLPGILYHGNPSGARSGRVPIYTGKPGEVATFEEHRFPMPWASFEWPDQEQFYGAALHSLPSPVPYGNLPDQWWSLGVASHPQSTELLLLSGPCASNGRKSVVKASQSGFVPYDEAYLKVTPNAIIEKTFFIQAYPVRTEGTGFQQAVHASLELFRPFESAGLPSFADILAAKYRYTKTRWVQQGAAAGFRKYPNRNMLVLGWCGQAAAPGYALQVLSDVLGDPAAREMARKSLDFLTTAEFYDQGFHTWYDMDTARWHQPGRNPELLSQGQAMQNIANAIRVGRTNQMQMAAARWEQFLRKACDFHAARILSPSWNPPSTSEAFFIAPLCQASKLFDTNTYRKAAMKAGQVYASRHLAMREPYWGGTLDASCEDKEGAWAALEGFLALYELTQDSQYLTWARHAADVVLTYLVVWDIDLPAGRLRDHGFKTRGWTAVSVQNQHIDVYGVIMAPILHRLGQITGDTQLQQLALVMFRSCGQLLDPYGSQGEQPQHTNYAQRGRVASPFGLRGGYVEDWTVFWITAHFLNAAAQFREGGVAIHPLPSSPLKNSRGPRR